MNILLAEKFKKHMLAELLSVDCSMHSTCIAETKQTLWEVLLQMIYYHIFNIPIIHKVKKM